MTICGKFHCPASKEISREIGVNREWPDGSLEDVKHDAVCLSLVVEAQKYTVEVNSLSSLYV